jgi:hypothetical protein
VFGWGEKKSDMGEGMGQYTEFQLSGLLVSGVDRRRSVWLDLR